MYELLGIAVGGLVVGVVIGAIIMFFVARNNQAKFIDALGIDFSEKARALMNETTVDEKVKKFITDIKAKFRK